MLPKKISKLNFLQITMLAFCGLFTSCQIYKDTPSNTERVKTDIISLLNDSSNHKLNFNIDSFPLKIIHSLENDAKERIIMANPKDRIRTSDGIDKDNYDLPVRRLLFWKQIKNSYIIVYERGGRTHNIMVLHFRYLIKPKLISSLSVFVTPEENSFHYIIEKIQNTKTLLLYNNNTKIKTRYYYY